MRTERVREEGVVGCRSRALRMAKTVVASKQQLWGLARSKSHFFFYVQILPILHQTTRIFPQNPKPFEILKSDLCFVEKSPN